MEQYQSLDILGAVENTKLEPEKFYQSAPSWCPDWSKPAASSCLIRRDCIPSVTLNAVDNLDGPLYSADGGIKPDDLQFPLFSISNTALTCSAIIPDRVSHIITPLLEIPSDIAFPPCDPYAYFALHHYTRAIPAWYTTHPAYANPYSDTLQAATAMLHGDVPSSWPPRAQNLVNIDETWPDQEPYICLPRPRAPKLVENDQTPYSRHVRPFAGSYSRVEALDIVSMTLKGRVPFVSEEGYMGLVPEDVAKQVREGSSLAGRWSLGLVAGCSVPLVLREREDGSWRVCGSCYVQGWMEGEVLGEMMGPESAGEFWTALGQEVRVEIR
ncbi:hypothetical protein MBLNU230_g8426t1 [Neophaeotheca triangularis]